MAGMFFTQDQVKEVGKISNRCALEAVAEAYGPTLGGALYASCLRNWEVGASITASVHGTGAVSVDMEVLMLEAET